MKLIGFESSQLSNRPYVRIGCYILYQECASLQERDIDGNLVLRTSKASGVGDDRDQGAVRVAVAHTNHEGGRTFPSMPRSKSHTSPRLGLMLLEFKVAKELIGSQNRFSIV